MESEIETLNENLVKLEMLIQQLQFINKELRYLIKG